MKKGSNRTERRLLLQSGLALLAGGAAATAAAGTNWSGEASAGDASPGNSRLTVYARRRPVASPTESRLVTSGELLDAPDGKPIGEFFANCFCLETPFGPHPAAASNLEFQVLQFKDGTLFGISAGSHVPGAPKAHALVGGTARYAGASGSYIERGIGVKSAGWDVVEFVVTFAG